MAKDKKITAENKPKFPTVGVPIIPKPFVNFKKPMFGGPKFNTAFKTQNRGGK